MKLVPLTAEPAQNIASPPASSIDWQNAAQRFHQRVLVTVLALGVRVERAEEIVQAAWSALIESERAGQLQRVELPGLAIVQARYLALNELRRNALENRLIVAKDDLSALADSRGGPEAELLAKEDAEQIRLAIEQMPESAQRLFRLLYADPKLPHAVAAQQLGLSLQRVRQLSSELKQRVRATFTREQR